MHRPSGMPTDFTDRTMRTQRETDQRRIAAAVEFLIRNRTDRPALSDVADHVHLSPFHFQRLFRERVGVTPKQFARFLSVEHAKKVLTRTRATLFDTANEVGLSTTSRLHDLFVDIEGMTPGEYRNGGANLEISYSFADTLFGRIIVGSTAKGICHMTFADEGDREALERLRSTFPNASYRNRTDPNQLKALSIFTQDWSRPDAVRLHLKGTEFQLKVWNTLLQVPSGGLVACSDLALKAGYAGAQRAVGTALGCNPVLLLIPCHRVIQASGIIGNYRYGAPRKNALIGWEAALCSDSEGEKRQADPRHSGHPPFLYLFSAPPSAVSDARASPLRPSGNGSPERNTERPEFAPTAPASSRSAFRTSLRARSRVPQQNGKTRMQAAPCRPSPAPSDRNPKSAPPQPASERKCAARHPAFHSSESPPPASQNDNGSKRRRPAQESLPHRYCEPIFWNPPRPKPFRRCGKAQESPFSRSLLQI